MKTQEVVILLGAGLGIWIVGTVYYGIRGPQIFESTSLRYWTAFVLSPVLSALLCIAILRWRRVPPAGWTSAMLLLAIPGMIGEAAVLSRLELFMPKLHVASGGRYGAFLFATYAVVLTVAELVTLHGR